MASTWAALADSHRRIVLELLLERPRGVGEITERLGLSQPGTSKHLRILREAGLVRVRPDAQRRVYELDPGPLAELADWLAPYRALWSTARNGSLGDLLRALQSRGIPRYRTDSPLG
jgi:DNA-binding transcriptional ArsR family regulator